MNGTATYPVLYLVHGAGDSDDSWTSEGHAHYILDNLIAAGKAKPMIVVMPFGHTPDRPGANMLPTRISATICTTTSFRTSRAISARRKPAESRDGRPVDGRRAHVAVRPHASDRFRTSVCSAWASAGTTRTTSRSYVKATADALQKASGDLKLVYYAMGKDDFLYRTVAPTRAMLDE